MPEASVHEHRCPELRKHKVRRPGQPLDLKSIPQAESESGRPQASLRKRVLVRDRSHVPSALRRCRDVLQEALVTDVAPA